MKTVVLDTDIFIDYLKGKNKIFFDLFQKAVAEEITLAVPTVILLEIFIGREFESNEYLEKVKQLLEVVQKIPLNFEVAMLAADLGRKHKAAFLGIADLVLVACAINLKAEIATRNIRHFQMFPEVRIYQLS